MTSTLADSFTEYSARPVSILPADIAARRAFYAGALAVIELQRDGATRDQLLAEIVGFGRAVGTAAERAAA